MPPPEDAGPLIQRIECPQAPARAFAAGFFPALAAAVVIFLACRAADPIVYAVFAAPIVGGVLTMLVHLKREAATAREKGLVVYYGSRAEVVDWPTVKGIEQGLIGIASTHVVLFHGGRRRVRIGTGDRAIAAAQEIVRRAGLRWLHEPFSAAR
jgi:hypothetical protein